MKLIYKNGLTCCDLGGSARAVEAVVGMRLDEGLSSYILWAGGPASRLVSLQSCIVHVHND